MATKFYFHDATSSNTGTLPGASTVSTTLTPEVTATGASTNRDASTTIGVSQVSIAITTLANTNLQDAWFRRFLSAPLGAQTISGNATFSGAGSESNGNSQFQMNCGVYAWRPSTGTLVGTLIEIANGLTTTEVGTTETALSSGATALTSTAVNDGDILVFELWRDNQSQLMSTAYTNTMFYDGTTEGSSTSNAANVNFANTITFFTAPERVPYSTSYPQLLPQ